MTFETRIGKVTPKKPKIAVITPEHELKTLVIRDVAAVMDSFIAATGEDGETLAGMAIVVWSDAGSSSCIVRADPKKSRLPKIMIPDYVRNRLFGSEVVNWSVDSALSAMGRPPKSG